MQDRYSGDVGDFGKFGLLRHLVNGTRFKLGINWCLFPDEGHNEDGRFTNYLSNPLYERCDNELHKKLKILVSNIRCVSALEKSNLFECKTIFFSELVDFYPKYPRSTKVHKEKRLLLRNEWQEKAIIALSNTDALFLDPDNGLQIDSCKSLNQKRSGKFSYFEEIRKFHDKKQFTIIYHHLNRHINHGSHSKQIKDRAKELKNEVNSEHTVFCIRYSPYSPRAFFIIASPNVVGYINQKLNNFLESSWGRYWDSFYVH